MGTEESKILKHELIDFFLINIYRTKESISTFWFDGLGDLSSYKLIIEINNKAKYQLESDGLYKWNNEDEIVELETKFKNEIKRNKIKDVIFSKSEGIYLRLENDMIVYHDNTFGSELGFEKYSELFDKNGKLI